MDIAKRILSYCDALDISVNHLADISGVAQSTLQSVVSGTTSTIQLNTLEKICDGLGITLEDFVRDNHELPVEAQQELNLFKEYLKWKYKG